MSDEQDLVWEQIYKIARISALRSNRMHRNLVSVDDIYQHLSLWALEHWHKIEEWNTDDSMPYKLRKTFNNEAQKLVAKERAIKSRSPMSDSFYYTPEVLHELLRDVWTHEGWDSASDMSSEFVSKSSKPAEGNNRLALLSDVKQGLSALSDADQELLRNRYHDGGMEFEDLSVLYEASEEAMRKRVKRAIIKLQDRLGGEPPVWRAGRRRKSNAQAQAELKENE
jgi:DNA-directed RNA polymerase specialized sigma24 family protein